MNSGGAGRTALIYGIAVAGDALATGLMRRGWRVLVADDAPTEAKRALAAGLGTNLVEAPDTEALAELVAAVDIVCPAPGVPETHPVVAAAVAAGTPLRTEIDLAYEFEQQRPGGPRPMLAITGTEAHILEAAGHRASAVGNTDVPLVAALDDDVDVFAVECSSFRLNWLLSFRAEASVWLNLAPDHQNWHTSMASYEAAKARMWAHRRPTDVAIGFADDETVMRNLRAAGGPTRTFAATNADYRIDNGSLVGPSGIIAPVACMTRTLPHDLTNALAAAALVLESGLATAADVQAGLATFHHPPHRIEPLGTIGGVQWFNERARASEGGRRAGNGGSRCHPAVPALLPNSDRRLDGTGGATRRRARRARRRGAALAGMCQLRLVPRGWLPGPRRRLQAAGESVGRRHG